jgi:hypothetical protein
MNGLHKLKPFPAARVPEASLIGPTLPRAEKEHEQQSEPELAKAFYDSFQKLWKQYYSGRHILQHLTHRMAAE